MSDIADRALAQVASRRGQPDLYAGNDTIIDIYEMIAALAQRIDELMQTTRTAIDERAQTSQGKAGLGTARHGGARHGKAKQGKVR